LNKATTLLTEPFKVVSEKKEHFLIWFLFTIVAGQIGIIANIIVRYYANATPITNSIYLESSNGSFYTFSIVLVASILGPLFINLINSEKLKFRTLKTFTIIIAGFFLLVTGIIYAAVQSQHTNQILAKSFVIDWTQLLTYFISIALVSYGYCILRLEHSSLDFSNIDDPLWNEQDDEKVEEVISDSEELTSDSDGNEL
jgi:hypothetical protein